VRAHSNRDIFAGEHFALPAVGANASRVQRTQRIVTERAVDYHARRAYLRVIAIAALVCSAILGIAVVPLWNSLDEFAHWSGIPDLQIHMFFLAVWLLPATIAVLFLSRSHAHPAERR
jgi:hypothetical protein